MRRGRKLKIGNQICLLCGKLGYQYPVYSWNGIVREPRKKYFYLRFKHNDGSKYCNIDKKYKERSKFHAQHATEYRRLTKEGEVYSFPVNPDKIGESYPHSFTRFEEKMIVIYDIHKASLITDNTSKRKKFELELKRLRRISLKSKDMELITSVNKRKQGPIYEFLLELSRKLKDPRHDFIITYGDKAVEDADKISRLFPFIGEIIYLPDQHGVLADIERKKIETSIRSESAFGRQGGEIIINASN